MPFNGSGTFDLSQAGQPVVTQTTISSTMFNGVLTELEVGLSTCIAKDGQTTTTASIPFAAGISVTGTATLNSAVVLNESGGDNDIRIESDTNANHVVSDAGAFSGVGAFSIGRVAAPASFFLVNPLPLTAGADVDFYRTHLANNSAVTVPVGTAAIVATAFIDEPNITATGTVTLAASCYINGAPTEGSSNYAVLVASGATNLQGSLQCDSIVNDTGLAHGTYAPTLTAVANLDSAVQVGDFNYLRVGNQVYVSGQITLDPTAASDTSTAVGISLPVASDLGSTDHLTGLGMGACSTGPRPAAVIAADSTNNRAQLTFNSDHTDARAWKVMFQYRVI